MVRISSLSAPRSYKPRKLLDWFNLTGKKNVHSLVDKVYEQKNLELALEKVKKAELKIQAALDHNLCQTRIKVSKQDFNNITLEKIRVLWRMELYY